MWSHNNNFPAKGFSTPPPTWKSKASFSSATPVSEKTRSMANKDDLFHVVHKVPAGDSPYVRAKQVQVCEVSLIRRRFRIMAFVSFSPLMGLSRVFVLDLVLVFQELMYRSSSVWFPGNVGEEKKLRLRLMSLFGLVEYSSIIFLELNIKETMNLGIFFLFSSHFLSFLDKDLHSLFIFLFVLL